MLLFSGHFFAEGGSERKWRGGEGDHRPKRERERDSPSSFGPNRCPFLSAPSPLSPSAVWLTYIVRRRRRPSPRHKAEEGTARVKERVPSVSCMKSNAQTLDTLSLQIFHRGNNKKVGFSRPSQLGPSYIWLLDILHEHPALTSPPSLPPDVAAHRDCSTAGQTPTLPSSSRPVQLASSLSFRSGRRGGGGGGGGGPNMRTAALKIDENCSIIPA